MNIVIEEIIEKKEKEKIQKESIQNILNEYPELKLLIGKIANKDSFKN